MRDYKIIQKVNNKLKSKTDLHIEYIVDDDPVRVVQYALKYFSEECPTLEYPAKSYAVAIIYAYLIQKHFGVDFFESLNEDDLLCHNDQFFKTYSQSQDIYDAILKNINFDVHSNGREFGLNMNLSQIKSTVNYFLEEFSLDESSLDSRA